MFFITLYRNIKNKHGRKTSFVILFFFLVSFLIARTYAFLSTQIEMPIVSIRDIHIHHLNFGIFFLAISGFLGFYLANSRFHRKIIILYGIGLGLTFDEFGMWLHLEDHYWVRVSYDSVIIISLVLANAVFFGNFWMRISRKIVNLVDPHYKNINQLIKKLKNSKISSID